MHPEALERIMKQLAEAGAPGTDTWPYSNKEFEKLGQKPKEAKEERENQKNDVNARVRKMIIDHAQQLLPEEKMAENNQSHGQRYEGHYTENVFRDGEYSGKIKFAREILDQLGVKWNT